MGNPKGPWAEREAAGIIADLLGVPVKRRYNLGTQEDIGDLIGVPNTTIQVAWWPKRGPLRAVREKPEQVEQQRANAGDTFACSFIRLHGGLWRVCMTPEQWATYQREVM